MNSKYNIKKIVQWLTIIMVASFIMAGGIFFATGGISQFTGIGSSQANVDQEKTVSADGLKEINVSTVRTDVNFIASDSNEVKLHLHGWTPSGSKSSVPQLTANADNGKLTAEVKDIEGFINIGFYNSSLTLDVYVPKAYSESVHVSTTSGRLNIEQFTLNSLSFNSVSGGLDLSSVSTNDTVIGTTSGGAKLEGFKGNLKFNSVSGGLKATYTAFNNNISVKSVSGGANLTLPANSEFNVHFSSTSGNLDNKFPAVSDGSSGGHSVDGTVGSGSNKITIETTSGGASIDKE